jgi:hypothetical protein
MKNRMNKKYYKSKKITLDKQDGKTYSVIKRTE